VQRKIAFSNEINQSRLNVLKVRDEVVQQILAEALDRLAEWTRNAAQYEALVTQLLTQGLCKIGESDVTVVCRKEDIALIQKVLPDALTEARTRTENPKLQATLTDKFNLSPARTATNKTDACCGGALLSARGGKILCNQTLDARLTIAFKKQLPAIREALFGVNPNRKYHD